MAKAPCREAYTKRTDGDFESRTERHGRNQKAIFRRDWLWIKGKVEEAGKNERKNMKFNFD